jgi:hypothetical protein
MNENTTPNISAGSGSLINTGTLQNTGSSTLNLGTLSGTVTHTISQLPPEQTQLKVLLQQLHDLLDSSALSAEDKADALEQVQVLAQAAQAPAPEQQTQSSKALRFLRRIVDAIRTTLPTALL